MEFTHLPVMPNEVIDLLDIKPDGTYIDGTVGGAGHSSLIAKNLNAGGRLIGIDKDPNAIKAAAERLSVFPFAEVIREDFRNIKSIKTNADGILLDLGVSSHQLDDGERGFSYKVTAPLDMRMSQTGISAKDVVNGYSVSELERILREYGEEKFSFRIAQNIDFHRKQKQIETTTELANIISEAIPAKFKRTGGNPAKQSFQAIRIEVNGELDALKIALNDCFDILNSNGRFVIITFHSLEDRLVKQAFSDFCTGCTCPPQFPVCVCGKKPKAKMITKKPLTASEEELKMNNRSHSAKVRCIEKI